MSTIQTSSVFALNSSIDVQSESAQSKKSESTQSGFATLLNNFQDAVRNASSTDDVAGADLRVALGSTRLKSILIDDIRVQGDQVTFQGRGFGHGVGMCQWGAYTLAKEGKKPEEIVRYFFKGVKVERLYS